jgi:regulator of sirC expression with transglutaminase-like and TPR domain
LDIDVLDVARPTASIALFANADPWSWLRHAKDHDIPLFEASLLIAQDEYPALDVAKISADFHQLKAMAGALVTPDSQPLERLKSLNHFLFDAQGFSGNFLDYYNPRNSYLNDVLERKLGIPISLAVLYVELGRALGVELTGVSFPGHFLVRVPVEGGLIIIDPFNRGKSIGAEELKFRARSNAPTPANTERGDDDTAELSENELFTMLAPCDNRAVLVRMLHNLRSLYVNAGDTERALRVAHRLVQLTDAASERRDRGMLYLQIGAQHAARADLAAYLNAAPKAQDAHAVHEALLRAQHGPRLN